MNCTEEEALYELAQARDYHPTESPEVARLLAWWFVTPRSYEWRSGVWLVELADGTRAAFLGWHDTTGWGCQSDLAPIPFDRWEGEVEDGYDPDQFDAPLKEVMRTLRKQLAERLR